MIHNLWLTGFELYKKENPCHFKNELVQNHFTIFQPGLMGRAWSAQDGRPRPTTPDFNCSIFIFYFQKLSFSNKSHQTRKKIGVDNTNLRRFPSAIVIHAYLLVILKCWQIWHPVEISGSYICMMLMFDRFNHRNFEKFLK